MDIFGNQLTPPGLIQGVCLLHETRDETFKSIIRLERPPPSQYTLSRHLFGSVLEGQPLEWAMRQARSSMDDAQRSQAVTLLQTCQSFLKKYRNAKILPIARTSWKIREDFELRIHPDSLVQTTDERFGLMYHFWQDALTDKQLRIILRVLKDHIWQIRSYAGMQINLVTAPVLPALEKRRMRVISCDATNLASAEEVSEFGARLYEEWIAYHRAHPKRSWS